MAARVPLSRELNLRRRLLDCRVVPLRFEVGLLVRSEIVENWLCVAFSGWNCVGGWMPDLKWEGSRIWPPGCVELSGVYYC